MTDESTPNRGIADTSSSERHQQLRDVFVAATDVEGFTETQDQRATSRRVADEESRSVQEAVTAIVKADGLTDAYTDPVYDDGGG